MQGLKEFLDKKSFKKSSKPVYEYQDLCVELQEFYGKGIWRVPCLVGVTNNKIRDAHKANMNGKKVFKVAYLIGIIRKLK